MATIFDSLAMFENAGWLELIRNALSLRGVNDPLSRPGGVTAENESFTRSLEGFDLEKISARRGRHLQTAFLRDEGGALPGNFSEYGIHKAEGKRQRLPWQETVNFGRAYHEGVAEPYSRQIQLDAFDGRSARTAGRKEPLSEIQSRPRVIYSMESNLPQRETVIKNTKDRASDFAAEGRFLHPQEQAGAAGGGSAPFSTQTITRSERRGEDQFSYSSQSENFRPQGDRQFSAEAVGLDYDDIVSHIERRLCEAISCSAEGV